MHHGNGEPQANLRIPGVLFSILVICIVHVHCVHYFTSTRHVYPAVKPLETDSVELQREKMYLQMCAPRVDSNQTAHPHNLRFSLSASIPEEILFPWLCTVRQVKTDQSADAQINLNLWTHISEGTISSVLTMFYFVSIHRLMMVFLSIGKFFFVFFFQSIPSKHST